ncbi:hypothetical protein AB0M43_05070 [Longispora sp. NPDC051575]|uniref:hypothetical protein n=1 Tax=Longispora sp. NPDC051575 TaxID=3154943 RepID=UPI0034344E09
MSDEAQMWITAVPAFGPEDVGVLLGVDLEADDPGQRMVAALLDRGHEGEEGVFYLLPDDLTAHYDRRGDRLVVRLLASAEVIDQVRSGRDEAFAASVADLWGAEVFLDRVTLVRREVESDFEPGAGPDGKQAVLLVDTAGPTTLPAVFGAFEEGEAGFTVVNAT